MSSDTAILEAALEQLALTGVRRTSTDDIARRAGVNRATLYRRFGNREQLLGAVYLHEAGRLIGELERRVEAPPVKGESFDGAANVTAYFRTAVRLVRDDTLLTRMLEVDREDTLAALTVEAGPALRMCIDVLVERIEALHRWQGRTGEHVADIAATLARIAQSLVLTPDAPPALRTDADFDRFARAVTVPLVLG